jgi:hypothetical protein
MVAIRGGVRSGFQQRGNAEGRRLEYPDLLVVGVTRRAQQMADTAGRVEHRHYISVLVVVSIFSIK